MIKIFLISIKKLGIWIILLSTTSLLLIINYERTIENELTIIQRIIGLISYSIFSSVIIYFTTNILPIATKQAKLASYLASKAYRIHINTSTAILTLLNIARDEDPNRRNRSTDEWRYICLKTNPYVKIDGGFFQRESFDDFYHYFQEFCIQQKGICSDLITFSDLLNYNQIYLLSEIDSKVSLSSLFNKGVKVGSLKGPNSIPEIYGYTLRNLYNSSKDLYESFGKVKLIQ
jgi:hypothetical protein